MSQGLISKSAYSRIGTWCIAVVLVCLGIYLSITQFMGREWLTRAGCLVAMLGIWSGLGGIIQERILTTRIRRKQRNAIVHARAKLLEKDIDPKTLDTEIIKINDLFNAQLSHAAERLRLSVGIDEVVLVLTGTFIWGFGDLFVS